MTIQNVVWPLSLLGITTVAAVFVFVINQAKISATEAETRQSTHTAHVMRAWFFGILVTGFVLGTWLTLRHFPIPQQHAALQSDQIVNVEGFMWGWIIQPTKVKAEQVVEFRVTSKDVNHGFALYSPDGNLVAQTQAMPGYVNKLLYQFEQAGTYTVQCLEYCGVAHGAMKTVITVSAPAGEK